MTDFSALGRLFLLLALLFLVLGLFFLMAPRIPWLGQLPGDIRVQRGNMSCWAPIATSILLSLLLTVGLNVILWLIRRFGGN